MAPGLSLAGELCRDDEQLESRYQKGVKYLCDNSNGIMTRVPAKYVLPAPERPNSREGDDHCYARSSNLNLPVIDFAELQGPNRSQVIQSLAKACEEYGFFQVGFRKILANQTSFLPLLMFSFNAAVGKPWDFA